MADDLIYGVELAGADEAARKIEDLRVKQAQVASEASALATQVRAAEKAAADATGQAGVDAQQKLDGLRRQLIQTQRAAGEYGRQASQLEQQARNGAVQFGALGAAIGATGQAIGRFDQASGQMVSALGQTVSQLPQLVQQFGLFGGAVAGANLALSAFSIADQQFERIQAQRRAAVDQLATSFDNLESQIRQAQQAQDDFANVQSGGGSASQNTAHRVGLIQRLALVRAAEQGDRTALERIGREGIPELGIPANAGLLTASSRLNPEVGGSELAARALMSDQGLGQGAAAALFGTPTATQQQMASAAANAILRPLEQQIQGQLNEFQTTLQTQAERRYAESLAGGGAISESGVPGGAPTRRGGRGQLFNANNEYERARLQEQQQYAQQVAAAEAENQRAQVAQLAAWRAQMTAIDQQSIDAQFERQRAADQRARELQQEHLNVAADAIATFRDANVRSTDDIIAAWNRANDALAASGREQLSTARLLERGMSAVGASIADSIGNKITGGIEQSVGAVLDGSKSFEQAMADMAKSVLKSLVTESIVQTIVETARGIASLASYDYGGAALHFAAAGTWAAVGGIAGGIGAATGAFGGGGASAAGGAANARAAANTNAQAGGAGGGSTTIYINMPPGTLTNAERGVAVNQAFVAARRQGYRVAA